MNLKPADLPRPDFYRLLISAVVPRPIAWVSTLSKEGIRNQAPFSFFNAISATPPLLVFAPGIRSREFRQALGSPFKDTLQNVRDTGEFVVNTVPFSLAEKMNITSGEYEASVDEFEMAGLTPRPSRHVQPPHVAESPVSFECKVVQILDFGTETAGASLVIGEILLVHVADELWREGRLDAARLDLVGRMGGIQYCRTTERFEMPRPGLQVKPSPR